MVEEFRACYNLVYNLISRYGDVGRCRKDPNLRVIFVSRKLPDTCFHRSQISHRLQRSLGEGGGVKLPLRLFFHRAASVKK